MSSSEPEPTLYIAYQPIFTKDMSIHAYELLFREGAEELCIIKDGDHATKQVVFNAIEGFGLDRIVGGAKAFINHTRGALLAPSQLPHDRVVIEILEDVVVDKDMLRAVIKLYEQGYKIALDDFQFHESFVPLLELAHYVKIDLSLQPNKELPDLMRKLKPYQVELVAEKIENEQDYELCKQLGFDYFQGYYLQKPIILKGEKG